MMQPDTLSGLFGATRRRGLGYAFAIVELGAAILLTLAPAAKAQDPPLSASLVGEWGGIGGEYGDVWGDGNYAYVCSFGAPRVHIIDISDPSAPFEAARFVAPDQIPARRGLAQGGSAQDVKVAAGLMFVGVDASELPGSNGRTVIADVRDPANPIALTIVDTMDQLGVHNVFYAGGYLYQADTERPIISIVDLTTYDPDNAPSLITTEKWRLTGVGHDSVHDITVKNGRLYAAAWNGGLYVYDVSNIGVAAPVLLGTYPGKATHSVWPTGDGRFVVTGEERSGGGIKVHRVIENVGSITLELTDKLKMKSRDASSVHNQVIAGNRLYNSWYEAGLRVYDIDPQSGLLYFVAAYDTEGGFAGSFYGAWGVYPLLGPDRVLVSDIRSALSIVNVHGQVPCGDLRRLRSVKCKRGRIKAKVLMNDKLRDRQRLTFSFNGVSLDTRVKRRSAKLKHDGGYTGPQTLTLTDPPGCFPPVAVDCG